MGAFLYHEHVEEFLPELREFINETFQVDDAYVWAQFFDEDSELSVRFHAGEYKMADREIRWEISPQARGHDYHGEFRLTCFPGNGNIVVSNGLFLGKKTRGKGLGQFLQDFKKKIARKYNFNTMYCTSNGGNTVENYLLQKNGWKVVGKSLNYGGESILEWRIEI